MFAAENFVFQQIIFLSNSNQKNSSKMSQTFIASFFFTNKTTRHNEDGTKNLLLAQGYGDVKLYRNEYFCFFFYLQPARAIQRSRVRKYVTICRSDGK